MLWIETAEVFTA